MTARLALDSVLVEAAPVDLAWTWQHPSPCLPGVPAALLARTWLGSTLANLAFFGRPAVAGYGFATLGGFAWPYLSELLAGTRGPASSDARHRSGAHHPSPAGGTS